MRRRNFLKTSIGATASVGIGLLAGSLSSASKAVSSRRLHMPPLLDTLNEGRLNLNAQYGKTRFLGTGVSLTKGFNQGYLGPTIRMKNGLLEENVRNSLAEDITVHYHGLLVPGRLDGGPQSVVTPGSARKAELNIDQEPSTLWYHSHIHRCTGNQVYFGLAGAIQVTDGLDEQRGLPSQYGIDDLTMIIQDRRFDNLGRIVYSPRMSDVDNGFHGERVIVNGQFDTVAVVPKGIVRLRLINASNARIYSLGFDDGKPLHLIGTDGGLLDKPVLLNYLRLIPGERAEVLVDFSNGSLSTLISKRGNRMQIQKFVVDDSIRVKIKKVPDFFNTQRIPSPTTISKTRRFSLTMGGGSAGQPSSYDTALAKESGYICGSRGAGDMATDFGINARSFDMNRIDFEVALGSVERWIIRGAGAVYHPFHVHGVHFRVLSEDDGLGSRQENTGWKDTVLASGETEILIHFTKPAGYENPFMYHCHILEHEDAGMMGQFVVI